MKKQSGFVLVYLLAFSVVIGVLISVLLSDNVGLSVHLVRRTAAVQAEALADAGLEQAIVKLRASASYSGETLALGNGSVTTTIQADGLNRIITATATIPGILGGDLTRSRRIIAEADPEGAGTAFSYAIQTDTGGFTTGANKNPKINGNLYSNENVAILGNGANVTGNVSAAGTVTNNGTIQGTVTQGAPVQPMPVIDIDGWKELAEAGQTHTGDLTITTNGLVTLGAPNNIGVIDGRLLVSSNATIELTGPIWVKGVGGSSIEISANPNFILDSSQAQAVILADGSLTFSGNARFETESDDSDLLVMTLAPGTYDPNQTAVAVNANTRFVNAGLYAPNGQIAISQSASGLSITSFTAAKVFVDSNAQIDYSEGLIDANFSPDGPTGGTFTIKAGSYQALNP